MQSRLDAYLKRNERPTTPTAPAYVYEPEKMVEGVDYIAWPEPPRAKPRPPMTEQERLAIVEAWQDEDD